MKNTCCFRSPSADGCVLFMTFRCHGFHKVRGFIGTKSPFVVFIWHLLSNVIASRNRLMNMIDHFEMSG